MTTVSLILCTLILFTSSEASVDGKYISSIQKSLLLIIHSVFPSHYTSTLGGGAVFNCFSSSNDNLDTITWSINGTVLSVIELFANVSTTFSESTRSGSLIIRNLPMDFNVTRIQCTATFISSAVAVSSSVAVLLIQGMW